MPLPLPNPAITNSGRLPHKAIIRAALAVLFFFSSFSFSSATATPTAVSSAPGIYLLHSDQNSVVFDVIPPALERASVTLPTGGFDHLRLPGYGRLAQPGRPDLPQKGIFIALPPGAEPHLTILEDETRHLTNVAIAPAATQQLVNYDWADPNSLPQFENTYPIDDALYHQNALFPEAPAALEPISWLRDQRVVKVIVYPLQANPAARSLTLHSRLQLQITFDYPDGRPATAAPRPESAAFDQILANALLNGEQAKAWRQPHAAPETMAVSPCLGSNAYRITLNQSGIYELEHSDLPGLPVSVAASKIRVCKQDYAGDTAGGEIAVKIEDADGDGNFESGDKVTFYGEAIKTQETATNVYWFTWGGTISGKRMATAASVTTGTADISYVPTYHLESDTDYRSQFPEDDLNDHWYMETIAHNISDTPNSVSASFTLNNKTTGSYNFDVQVEVTGYLMTETHIFEVTLNDDDNSLGTNTFTANGRNAPLIFTYSVPSTYLIDGSNTLTVTALVNGVSASHIMLVNWMKVSPSRQFVAESNRLAFTQPTAGNWKYTVSSFTGGTAQIFNVTDPVNVVEITGATGTGTVTFGQNISAATNYEMATAAGRLSPLTIVKDTTSNLGSTANRADYIIITDPTLDSALTALRNHRSGQGLAVKTVYVQDIFDEFSDGLYAPEAIRDFLVYAYNSWTALAPSYVLLAGDGSYDHRNVKGQNGVGDNLVPVYLKSGVDSELGEAASDNHYVDVVEDSSNLADMMLGRLPARNTTELTAMVNKIIAYETAATDTFWQADHFYVVDNGLRPPAPCTTDPAGDFFQNVDNFLAEYFPATQFLGRVQYAPTACYPNSNYPTYLSYFAASGLEVEDRLISAINEGQQFVIYTGHSATTYWGDPVYFDTNSVNLLTNSGRTPIMLPMTCLEGRYEHPAFPGLSETLLRKSGGGAVASYSPTGLQVQKGHEYLLEGFYTAVFEDDATTLGQAVMGAKEYLDSNGPSHFQDLQDTYMLQGDPAMQLNIWQFTSQVNLPALYR